MNDIQLPSVNKEAKLLLSNIFFNRQIQLESVSKERMVFKTQMVMRSVQDKVEHFIKSKPNGIFEIRVLEAGTDDMDNFKYALVIKNYKKEQKNSILYFIIISNTFSPNDVTFYEMSSNGVRMPAEFDL